MQDFYIYFQNTNRFVIKISFLSRYRPIYPPFSLILRNFRIFALDLDASATSVKIIFSTFFVIFCFNTLLTTIYQKMSEFGDYHYQKVKIPSGSYRQCLLRGTSGLHSYQYTDWIMNRSIYSSQSSDFCWN